MSVAVASEVTMNPYGELGTFLRTRRARLDPADIGLQPTRRRRVPGLRREELAVLIGVSPDYYARLEQGRQRTASPSVLDAVAQVLQLTQDERRHLFALADAGDPRSISAGAPENAVDPRTRRVVEMLGNTPAVLCGPYTDILAANDAACFLLGDLMSMPTCERSGVRWMLTPETQALYGDDWEHTSAAMIGILRLTASRRPGNRQLHELVTKHSAESELFREVWAEHRVAGELPPGKTLNHPTAGRLEFTNELLTLHSAPEQFLFLMIPRDTSRFETAFRQFTLGEP